MSETPRIQDLERRLAQDPASIAFAQLAEEYRRAGRLDESVEACRAGLARHPNYLSARVTLGRALWDLGRLDEAQAEFETVCQAAPDNLAALRSLAEIHQIRGKLAEALELFTAALALARKDPDLQRVVADLRGRLVSGGRAAAPAAESPAASISRAITLAPPPVVPLSPPVSSLPADPTPADRSTSDSARRTVVALERWLEAIHVARTQPGA